MTLGVPGGRADPRAVEPDESGADPALGSARPAPRGDLIDWVLVALITLLTGWTAVVGVAFLPWHLGAVPMPVSALLGVAAMILGPRAAYALTGSLAAAALPVASWFLVSVWLVLLRNPMMPTQAVSVVQGQWRVMVLLGLGSLAAAATLTLLWADRTQARYAARRAGPDAPAPPAGAGSGSVEPDEPPARPR